MASPVPQSHLQRRRPAPVAGSARSRHPSSRPTMAAGAASVAKENAAPSTSDATASAAAACRRHRYAVKSCGVKKRPSRAPVLGRVPLRDITNLIEAISGSEAPLGQEVSLAAATQLARPDAVLPGVVRRAALQGGSAAGLAALRPDTPS